MEKVYDDKTEARIRQEFTCLKDVCYLDHAGATLYSETQIRNISDDLISNVYGNPHSLNHSSKQSTDLIDQVRRRILKFFHTSSDEYSLIFTSGATTAIKLVLENFDWEGEHIEEEAFIDTESHFVNRGSCHSAAYLYTQSSHTSIVGGREIAIKNGVPFFCLEYKETFSLIQNPTNRRLKRKNEVNPRTNSLFAYPAQCNFSGRKYPLEWVRKIQNGVLDSYGLERDERRNSKWFCLLDAAAYCSTNELNLSEIQPDFVCISFYKIFGYPTGLGALLVRNSSAYVLRKRYFGGGTVDLALPFHNYHKKRRILHERFEDGTISFLSIISLEHGLNTLNRLHLDMNLISQHVFSLAKYATKKLKGLTHWNGNPVVELYADTNYDTVKEQGGIVNFNLKRANDQYIGFVEVLHMANLRKIYVRTGCFCNLGACQRHLKLTDADLKFYYQAGHVCGDTKDLVDGKPTGSVRVSFGYMTTESDVDKLINMIKECFVEIVPQIIPHTTKEFSSGSLTLSRILLFPIKSCGAMDVKSWKLNMKGLEYDREWMIITSSGVCLTQKQQPKLCMIRPKMDLESRTLTLAFESDNDIITLPIDVTTTHRKLDLCESKVCNNVIQAYDCGDEISEWLSLRFNTTGLRLVKQAVEDERQSKKGRNIKTENEYGVKLSLSNQAQFLLINNESIRWLKDLIGPDSEIDFDNFSDRFRGNFYIDGGREFSENNWTSLTIGNVPFRVEGPCGRCQMICIDQKTGEKNRKPLVTLSRALSGKLNFGIYLSKIWSENDSEVTITVGDSILAHEKN